MINDVIAMASNWEDRLPGLSMGHIYLSHSHPIAIYACPIPRDVSHGIPRGMTFPWTSLPKMRRSHYYEDKMAKR